MIPLRRTALKTMGQLRPVRGCGVLFVALGLLGCGRAPLPSEEPTPATELPPSPRPALQKAQETLPSPNVDRIRYDADQRVLNLYDLPNSDRWMVRLPNEAHGQPVGPQHRLPAGVDTSRTMVYYTRPGVRVSMAVSVAEIEAYQEGLVPSFAANP